MASYHPPTGDYVDNEGNTVPTYVKYMNIILEISLIAVDIFINYVALFSEKDKSLQSYTALIAYYFGLCLLGFFLFKKNIKFFFVFQIINSIQAIYIIYIYWKTKKISKLLKYTTMIINSILTIIKYRFGGIYAVRMFYGAIFRILGHAVVD